jgi:hypothetical protein
MKNIKVLVTPQKSAYAIGLTTSVAIAAVLACSPICRPYQSRHQRKL